MTGNSLLGARLLYSGVLAFLCLSLAGAEDLSRQRLLLDNDWRFTKDDPTDAAGQFDYDKVKSVVGLTGQGLQATAPIQQILPEPIKGNPGESVPYVQNQFDDSGWRHLNLPHDWGIEGPFDPKAAGDTGKLPCWGIGWYRHHFDLPANDASRSIFLNIDGAMSQSMVWVNGHFVGGWPYGYTSYQLELTPYLNYGGSNVIAIRLNNPKESSRWYPGGGIYRSVWLVKTSPIHVSHDGTYLTTPSVSADRALIDLQVSVDNQSSTPSEVSMNTQIYELKADDTRGEAVPSPSSSDVHFTIPAHTRRINETTLTVMKPKLWDITAPNRYVAVTTLTQNGQSVDEVETPFGIRTIRFDSNTGFYLNGRHVQINGVCDHSDLGALGMAVNTRALQRQIEILKEMGCNALRTSHNPAAPELLSLCDKMGILVMDEAFDCWTSGKNTNDYHLFYHDWHNKDLRSQIRRDRNHPCVIWSTGNEIQEQLWGQKISQDLTDIIHSEDPTRPVTAACSYQEAGFNGFQKTLDVFGYNYKYGLYESFHQKNPDQPLFGSETASCISSRGEYFFPLNNDKQDFQVSSYDLSAPGWASPPDFELKAEAKFPFVCGQFLWTGFDYLGEPTPYNNDSTNLLNFTDPGKKAKMEAEMKQLGKLQLPSRSSYFGAVDLAGFKKDLFYFMQAAWRPDYPMAHILPHWNWPERIGKVTPVFVYTSGDGAELFLNGLSLGKKQKNGEFRLRWDDVKYAPGELKVVAYKNGQPWAEEKVITTGPASKLILTPDRATLRADGRDLSFITVAVADAQGLTVPRTNNPIQFEITGPGEIIATDNGDATSLVSFQAKERQAFNGLALIIVRTTAGQAGTLVVTAKSSGLAPASTTLKSE